MLNLIDVMYYVDQNVAKTKSIYDKQKCLYEFSNSSTSLGFYRCANYC